MATRDEITALLQQFEAGDPQAVALLTQLLYEDLRRLASKRVQAGIAPHTITTRSLIDEAFLRLVDQKSAWKNRAHFMGVAAECMRRILIDNARKHKAEKRGGKEQRVDFAELGHEEADKATVDSPINVIALDLAMAKLRAHDPRSHEIVMRRFFGARTFEEIAEDLQLGLATVKRDWKFAKGWLKREIDATEDSEKF